MKNTCYWTFVPAETGTEQVRFGLSRRIEAQIVVTLERWQRLSKLLANEGYRVVELQEDDTATNTCRS